MGCPCQAVDLAQEGCNGDGVSAVLHSPPVAEAVGPARARAGHKSTSGRLPGYGLFFHCH